MKFGYNRTCLDHDPGPRHPETADRLEAITEMLETTHTARLRHPDPADPETVTAVHAAEYVRSIEQISANGGGVLDSDTVASERTWEAALASVGLAEWAAMEAAEAEKSADIPFALCRPPGHHALFDEAMGFCIFNNAAVAAQAAIDADRAETVAIVDWDVHHGNGTEELFLDRSDVPFVSVHEDGLYPGSGRLSEQGEGNGDGATLNLPLEPGAGTASFVALFEEVIGPWLERHDPELLLISAGFDAHRNDPISRMELTTEGYGSLAARILDIGTRIGCDIGYILEGGYGLDTLTAGVEMVHSVCNGYQPESPTDAVRESDRERIERAKRIHGIGS